MTKPMAEGVLSFASAEQMAEGVLSFASAALGLC
jgi:hypothetical protein